MNETNEKENNKDQHHDDSEICSYCSTRYTPAFSRQSMCFSCNSEMNSGEQLYVE